jgi:peptidoglycan lytic transglycosylase A
MTYKYSTRVISLIVACSFVWVLGCAVKEKKPGALPEEALSRVKFFGFPNIFDDMAYDGLADAIDHSLSYLKKRPPSRMFRFGKDTYDTGHLIKSLERFSDFITTHPSRQQLKKFIQENYHVYRSAGQDEKHQTLFTGYFEPILRGSLNKSEKLRFPVYARPDDLLTIDLALFSPKFKGEKIMARFTNRKLLPYHDRKEIDFEHAVDGKARTIAWVGDRIDLFFLQIQGSGKIYLDSGEALNVHYHTTNGRPYRSIGKLLIDEGKIPRSEMSMQRIRAYLNEHPEEIPRILNYNPSYVFFKIESDGPLGYINEKLTPGRSIATDRRLFPPAALAFIETKKPLISGDGQIAEWVHLSRFVLNQDTGGAIRGPGRADLFWGNGAYAEIAAGHMQHPGKLYFLVLKPES